MSQPVDRTRQFVDWLVRHRALVFVVAAALAIVSAGRTVLTYSALRSDLEELLPKSAPSVESLEVLRERLPGLRHLGVVVDTGGPRNVEAANRFVDDLAERVRAYPEDMVENVRIGIGAERRFAEKYALQLMDPSDVRRLTEAVEARRDWEVTRAMDMDLLSEEEAPPPEIPIAELREKYAERHGVKRDFPGDRFVSEDGRYVVMVIQASSQDTGYEPDKALLSRVEADIAELGFPEAYAPEMRVGFAGDVPTRVEEMEGLVVDLSLSGAIVALLVIAVIVWFFRSFRALLLLGIPLVFGTLYTFGLVALPPLSIRHLNSNTAFLGSIVVGNGINTGIILLARFREERWRGEELRTALVTAVRTTWRPTLAAAAAASAAYGSLIVTDFRGFNQFGWIGGIGMLTCWATTLVLAPPLIFWLGGAIRKPRRASGWGRFGHRLASRVLAHPRLTSVVVLALSAACAAGIVARSDNWLQTDFSKLRRRDSWEDGERYWGQRMDRTLGRYLTPTVVMPDTPEQAERIAAELRELDRAGGAGDLIGTVRSAEAVIPPEREEAIAEAKKLREVLTPRMKQELEPDDRPVVEKALTDEALEPIEPSDVPGVLAAGLKEKSGRMDRNILVFPELGSGTWDADRMRAFTRDLRAASAEKPGGEPAPIAGSLLLSSDIIDAMKSDGPRATAVALAVVIVVSILAFRSIGLSLAAVLSLVVGVVLMLGVMAWTGQKLNFSNFVALPITFGIGADYSINMLKRLQVDGIKDVASSVASTGGAVALCSATTIIGFGSLLVAQNQALFSFGVFAVAGEVACLLTAVLALPAMLRLLPSVDSRERYGGDEAESLATSP